MNAQHTPGPWTVQPLETNWHGYNWSTFAVRSPQNVCLAVVGEVDRYESERTEANARLIDRSSFLSRDQTGRRRLK